jgi:hypothetical protein
MGYGALYLSHKIVDYLAPNPSYVALVEMLVETKDESLYVISTCISIDFVSSVRFA